jgi:hypothetical protein
VGVWFSGRLGGGGEGGREVRRARIVRVLFGLIDVEWRRSVWRGDV